MTIKEINEALFELAGPNIKYYSNVIPNSKPLLGVKVPELRKLAKKIAKDNYRDFLQNNPMDTYELEMLQAFVIGYARDDISVLLKYFRNMVPYIHDWAVNDALCQTFSIARRYPEETYNMLMEYKDSDSEFEVRVVAVTLMSHFLNDSYIDRVIETMDVLKADDYYAKMGIAWAVATIMAKYSEKCFAYMKNCHLDDWTYNKSIQKMIESYRVSDADKIILRKMKR